MLKETHLQNQHHQDDHSSSFQQNTLTDRQGKKTEEQVNNSTYLCIMGGCSLVQMGLVVLFQWQVQLCPQDIRHCSHMPQHKSKHGRQTARYQFTAVTLPHWRQTAGNQCDNRDFFIPRNDVWHFLSLHHSYAMRWYFLNNTVSG